MSKIYRQLLKAGKKTYNHGRIVKLYLVYQLKLWSYSQTNDFAISNCLFGAVQLTKYTDTEKYSYFEYGIG